MKASELQLGDYITFKDCQQDDKPTIIRIAGILSDDTILASIDNCNALDEIGTDELIGIPLTPEILEKNGFEYERNAGYVYDDQMGIMVGYSTFPGRLRIIKDLSILYDSQDGGDISVHQLQHALKLCGIEKTIEL